MRCFPKWRQNPRRLDAKPPPPELAAAVNNIKDEHKNQGDTDNPRKKSDEKKNQELFSRFNSPCCTS
jgi:hypothetical protein